MGRVVQLNKSLSPSQYLIDLTIDVNKLSFSGKTTIIARKLGRPSKRITLHAKHLTAMSRAYLVYSTKSAVA